MLGHEVPFAYCRSPGKELFCRNIFNCWWQRFDVQTYVEESFTPEEIKTALSPPAAKISSLVEIITRARSTT